MNITNTPYTFMQIAVDAIQDSQHRTSKVAACLVTEDSAGAITHFAGTNYWPDPILNAFTPEQRIGNSSGTVHAETSVIFNMTDIEKTPHEKIELYVTDVPCPNCVKNMITAGVTTFYIDHKGFDKDYAIRRGRYFNEVSLALCAHAGVGVQKLYRKEQHMETILKQHAEPKSDFDGLYMLRDGDTAPDLEIYASLTGLAPDGSQITLISEPCDLLPNRPDTLSFDKYSPYIQPINRLLMAAFRYNLKPDKSTLFSSRIPSSRELVNLVGAGFTRLEIGNRNAARDDNGRAALEMLMDHQILDVQ